MNRVRRIILASVVGFVGLVVGYLILYALGLVSGLGPPAAGSAFLDLGRPIEKNPIEVVEFFSFDCIHCRRLDPTIERWQRNLPDGVKFRRIHVAFGDLQRTLALGHETLLHRGANEQNRNRIFRAIHDQNRRFTGLEHLAEFVDGYGINAEQFTGLANGNRIGNRVNDNMQRVRELGVRHIPAVLVANRYMVYPGNNRDAALSNIEKLVSEILADREPDLDALGLTKTANDEVDKASETGADPAE